ncbi:hypothetical protein [Virgibacillus salexigens]|uniref:hypothetical protein n=1 Tax=Virgibacillus salexigens TaxID=61016 RepID=UPI0019093C44|nr:hypothetical protein [Virgibacillus salexigens]
MKKVYLLMLSLVLGFVLVACGEESSDNENTAESKENNSSEEQNNDESKDKENTVSVEEGETIDNEVGKFTIANKKKDMNEVIENGPMKLTITGIQSATLEPNGDYKAMFDNKDKLTVVTVGMKTENTSEETVSFYPDQATLTTNAGDQVDADLMLSDDVGGDFYGQTKKEGEVIFQLDTPAADISDIKLIINGAHDENIDSLGEDIQLPLSF